MVSSELQAKRWILDYQRLFVEPSCSSKFQFDQQQTSNFFIVSCMNVQNVLTISYGNDYTIKSGQDFLDSLC